MNSIDCTRELLVRGASLDIKDTFGYLPLHVSADYGSVGVAALLIEAGASVNALAPRGVRISRHPCSSFKHPLTLASR